MKKNKNVIKTETFTDGGFNIDVIETKDEYEAWIGFKNFCVKDYMFGMSKKQSNGNNVTYTDFIEMVECELLTDKKLFIDDHPEVLMSI